MIKKEGTKISGAHFATKKEIEKEEFFQTEGCIYGEIDGKLLVESSYKNILMLAPTGTGKGVSFVIPNLLNWENSAIVHDIKLENYELTSGYRKNELKQKVFVWNPTAKNGLTNCYNPLDWISKDEEVIVGDIQTILKFLLLEDDCLQSETKAFLTAIILYMVAEAKSTTFGKILKMLRGDKLSDKLKDVLNFSRLHPVARMNISSFLQKSEKEKTDIVLNAMKALDLWSDPLIDKATSRSDFDVSTFTKEAQTLYVGVEAKDMKRLEPLFRIFYQQCVGIISSLETNSQSNRTGILMILDEFVTLGRMDFLVNMLPYTRGYKLKLCIIAQNIDQLSYKYEKEELNQILSNTNKIVFSNNGNTAQLMSNIIGDKITAGKNGSKSVEPLILAQEIADLERIEELILTSESKVIKCNKFFYYKNPAFEGRLREKAGIK